MPQLQLKISDLKTIDDSVFAQKMEVMNTMLLALNINLQKWQKDIIMQHFRNKTREETPK